MEDSAFEKAISKVDFYFIMNNIPVGIVFLKTPKGKITYANDRAKQLYGVNPIGLEIKDQATKLMTLYRANGEPYPTEDLPMSRAMRGINVTNEELIIQRHADDTRIIVSATAVTLAHENGEIVGAVGVFEDITERKNLEKKLHETERLAAIGATAGMVGHDIRNPLQAMTGEIYLLRNDLSSMPPCETCPATEKCAGAEAKQGISESLQSLEDNIGYISKIVADLQDYARTLNPEFVTVTDVCKVIADYVKQVNIPSNITVVQTCGAKIHC